MRWYDCYRLVFTRELYSRFSQDENFRCPRERVGFNPLGGSGKARNLCLQARVYRRGLKALPIILPKSSLVPRPRPAFRRFQYGRISLCTDFPHEKKITGTRPIPVLRISTRKWHPASSIPGTAIPELATSLLWVRISYGVQELKNIKLLFSLLIFFQEVFQHPNSVLF